MWNGISVLVGRRAIPTDLFAFGLVRVVLSVLVRVALEELGSGR